MSVKTIISKKPPKQFGKGFLCCYLYLNPRYWAMSRGYFYALTFSIFILTILSPPICRCSWVFKYLFIYFAIFFGGTVAVMQSTIWHGGRDGIISLSQPRKRDNGTLIVKNIDNPFESSHDSGPYWQSKRLSNKLLISQSISSGDTNGWRRD